MSAGSVRRGRYVLARSIGGGLPTETFLAEDTQRGQLVVVKRFSTQHADSWKQVELAQREARVLSCLQHPLLPCYLDHFEEDGALYTVMTRVEGEDLKAARRRGVRFGEQQILALFRDLALVFEYLHRQAPPIVHRDLKPSNIIVGVDGRYRVVDFGAVAERLRPEGSSTVVGTFGYMAPEQFQGRASIASDVYSTGATAMALLTGSEPEELPHVGLAIDVERALGASVSAPLRHLLVQMLEPNPERRPVDLGRLLAESPGFPSRELAPPRGTNAPAPVPWSHDFFAGPKTRISSLAMAYILFTLLLSEHPTVSAVVMFIVLPLITWILYLRRGRSKKLTPATRYVESPRDQR